MAFGRRPKVKTPRARRALACCGYATCRCRTIARNDGAAAQPHRCPVSGCGATVRGGVCPDPRGVH